MSSKASTSTTQNGEGNTKASMRKSQRTKGVKRRRKTGRLSQLVNIPMDVLMEIFGHLHPLDILHLARTTKAFRRVLMHRSSIFVWKAALSTVPGLPDCPPELSEPQWANLVFDAHCSICLRPNIRNVEWVLRVRLCTECTKLHITHRNELCLGEVYCYDLTSAVPHRYGKRDRLEFLRDEYQDVYAKYLAIKNLDARQTFLVERQILVARIRSHALICESWAGAQSRARSRELERLKSSRYQAIVDKLTALGWGDEIDKIPFEHALTNHKLVKVPQLLTDRIWENIKETMIEYMEEMEANRLAREREKLQTQRKFFAIDLFRAYKTRRAPFTNVMPEPLDFHAFGPIRELLDQPSDINVDSEAFLELMPKLDGEVEEWRWMILKEFIGEVKGGLMRRSRILDNHPLNLYASYTFSLQLACTVFACIPCTNPQSVDDKLTLRRLSKGVRCYPPTQSRSPHIRPLWFPRVLGHRCLTKPRNRDLADAATKLSTLFAHRQRWCCDSVIKVDEEACEAAVAIIKACQMEPSITTVDEMDDLDARLECLACLVLNVEDPVHIVFGWRSAVKHQREYHPSDPGGWRMLTAGEAEVARAEESGLVGNNPGPKDTMPSDRKIWVCLRCLDGPKEQPWMTLEEVERHLELSHAVVGSQVDRDYVKDFAAPELYATHTLFQAAMVKF